MDPNFPKDTLDSRIEKEQPSTVEWIKKMWYIYTMEYYSAIKKNGILPFATMWMDLEGMMLRKISQKEKDKNSVINYM